MLRFARSVSRVAGQLVSVSGEPVECPDDSIAAVIRVNRKSMGLCYGQAFWKGDLHRVENELRIALQCGIAIVTVALIINTPCAAQQLTNDKLSLSVDAKDGTYQLAVRGGQLVFTSGVAAQVNHQWLRSTEYPRHQVSESTFSDELGSGRAITVTNSGLPGES